MSSINIEPENLPDEAPTNHSKTRAGWVTNLGIVLGFVIGAIGFAWDIAPMLWSGVAIIVISLISGAVLRALGYGQVRKQES